MNENVPKQSNPSSFAVFPFLKTSAPVTLGGITLRSTLDTDDLSAVEATHVKEIAEMLFLQDHLRIRSASYARVPFVDLDRSDEMSATVQDLADLQAIVAYCYASPHPIFGDPFFRYEHASLALFSPGRVSIYVVRPEHHADWIGPENAVEKDHREEVEGYKGLYNFKHHFWVTKGSRLYPPVPHIGLNISQDMAADLGQFLYESSHYPLLVRLLDKPKAAVSDRILGAIDWFNSANRMAASEEESIVCLAVAFETLLRLPENDKKTERLIDSVSLLLGRFPRLDTWVSQFYQVRSQIAHEGKAQNVRYVASPSIKNPQGPLYHSLLDYGRQVFQLCVGALLFGAGLAEKAGLQEKLVTNQERFDEMCRDLSDKAVSPDVSLRRIASKLHAAERYRFVPESDFDIERILNCLRLAAKALVASDPGLEASVKVHFERIASVDRSDQYAVLDALRELDTTIARGLSITELDQPRAIAFRLVRLAWGCTFMNYSWLKKQRETQETEPTGS
jgi:hypothetical protein